MMKPVRNKVTEELAEIYKTLHCRYEEEELSILEGDESPYPFHMWLADVQQYLADRDSEIWKKI